MLTPEIVPLTLPLGFPLLVLFEASVAHSSALGHYLPRLSNGFHCILGIIEAFLTTLCLFSLLVFKRQAVSCTVLHRPPTHSFAMQLSGSTADPLNQSAVGDEASVF